MYTAALLVSVEHWVLLSMEYMKCNVDFGLYRRCFILDCSIQSLLRNLVLTDHSKYFSHFFLKFYILLPWISLEKNILIPLSKYILLWTFIPRKFIHHSIQILSTCMKIYDHHYLRLLQTDIWGKMFFSLTTILNFQTKREITFSKTFYCYS